MSALHRITTTDSVIEAKAGMRMACRQLALAAGDADFRWTQTLMSEHRFTLRRWSFEGSVEIDATPGDELTVVWLSGGDLEWIAGDEGGEGAGALMLLPGRGLAARGTRIDVNVLCLDRTSVSAVAANLYNTDGEAVRFGTGLPVSDAMGHHWIGAVETYRDLFADTVLWNTESVRSAAFRHLAVLTLETFQQTGEPSSRVQGAAELSEGFRRATAYIEDHASLDISDADIADAAQLSPVELGRAFESHSTQRPMERLRTARLAAAHADLLRAETTDGETVAVIAQRWGFTYPGDFARRYRERYGMPPKQTLDD